MNTCKNLLPCPSCPWRVDQDASVIPNYVQEKAEALLNTVGPDDAFRPIMACHHSVDEKMLACKGYLAQVGWSNINVRLMALRGEIPNPTEVYEACLENGIELHDDYETVLEKLSS